MPFKDVIDNFHIKQGRSILWLSNESGVTRFSIYTLCALEGIKTNKANESQKNRYKFSKHWATGLNKYNSKWAKNISKRMLKNNPAKKEWVKEKRAKTMENIFIKKLLPQEIIFKKILEEHSIDFKMQTAIGPYNADFLIDKLIIEIDSSDKWGIKRKKAADERDKYLNGVGYNVLRINKKHLCDIEHTTNILKTNNVIKSI